MSDTAGEMIAFASARLDEAFEQAATEEQRRYVQAMRGIVLMWDDTGPAYRVALGSGDKAAIDAAGKARWAVACAIGFIASARNDHPGFRPEWSP